MSEPAENSPIKIGAKTGSAVECTSCKVQVQPGEFHTFAGNENTDVYLCNNCKNQAEQDLLLETQNPNLIGAIVIGAIAAIVSGGIWVGVAIGLEMQIGYIAILVGFLISLGVTTGAGKKRGPTLQFMAVGITLITLLISEYITLLYFVRLKLLQDNTENYDGHFFTFSPFNEIFYTSIVSPMGLVIWGIALYVAFNGAKARNL